eukprot:g5980.t1
MTKKESAIDLSKLIDKGVHVKLTGGREVTGVLKGYDQLMNLVVDDAIEALRDSEDPLKLTNESRTLGLVVCRGPAVMLVSPTTGAEQIDHNPFHEEPGT